MIDKLFLSCIFLLFTWVSYLVITCILLLIGLLESSLVLYLLVISEVLGLISWLIFVRYQLFYLISVSVHYCIKVIV